MVQLTLTAEEAATLRSALQSYVSERLKAEETLLKRLLQQLGG